MDEVVPGLWMGGREFETKDLLKRGIHLVVNVDVTPDTLPLFGHERPWPPHFVSMHYPLLDVPYLPRDMGLLWSLARTAAVQVDGRGALNDSERHAVFIHCAAGLNRSGLLTAMTLIAIGWNAQGAIELIRKARGPMALSNDTFLKWVETEAKSAWLKQLATD